MTALSGFAAALPEPARLRERLRTLTLLEAAFGSRWPRYAYAAAGEDGFEYFRYENGGGDDYRVFLGRSSAFLRAFDHESSLSPYDEEAVWPGLLDGLPDDLVPLTQLDDDEPEFPALTLALWHGHDGTGWRHGAPEPQDGAEAELTAWMLEPLTLFTPAAVGEDLSHYYSRPVDAATIEAVLNGEPLSRTLVERLASGTVWDPVEELAHRLGAGSA